MMWPGILFALTFAFLIFSDYYWNRVQDGPDAHNWTYLTALDVILVLVGICWCAVWWNFACMNREVDEYSGAFSESIESHV